MKNRFSQIVSTVILAILFLFIGIEPGTCFVSKSSSTKGYSHKIRRGSESSANMISEEKNLETFRIRDLWCLPENCLTNSGPEKESLLLQAYLEDEDIEAAASRGVTIERQTIQYRDEETLLYGLVAWPKSLSESSQEQTLPGVLVAHTAVGAPEDFILWKLDALASLGYVACAIDMFGSQQALWNKEQSLAARTPLRENRDLLQKRVVAGYNALAGLPQVDSNRIGAVGYCFGGMCVLDLMRADLSGLKTVASFHGILDVPNLTVDRINPETKVMLFHGGSDPFVLQDNLNALKENLNSLGIAWEMHEYNDVVHAFTRPEKTLPTDKERGMYYCASANNDSWNKCKTMFREFLDSETKHIM